MAADLILIIHFCIVLFVVFGLVALPIGYLRHYNWMRNIKFRASHILLMGFITLEAVLGITCPLTILENILRQIEYQQSFVSYWLSHFIYWDLPAYFFVTLYSVCFCWSLLFWKAYPPNSHLHDTHATYTLHTCDGHALGWVSILTLRLLKALK